MEWLVLIALGFAVRHLWVRTGRLEARLAELEPGAPVTRTLAGPIDPPAPVPEPDLAPLPAPPPPAPAPPAIPDDEPPPQTHFTLPRLKFDFEDIFGRRLPIWGGGIALALAGIFLVRFSIEAGLLTPPVRVVLSILFGLALLAAAEFAYRYEERVRDPRVRQALAGAGLATLYAGFYLAGTVYGLIGTAAAFVGLAAVTAAAVALSWRFGLPSVVLGLVGGFAAPALVASNDANVPLLTLYLALVTGGLAWTGGRQGRPWLGWLALAGGFGWGGLLLLAGLGGTGDILAFGLFVALAGAALPLLIAADPQHRTVRLAAAGLGALQLAALVASADFAPLTWGLYLLLGAALAVLGWRDPRVREGSAMGLAVGLALLLAWSDPPPETFAWVVAGIAGIFLAVPLALVWLGKGRALDLWQVSLGAPALAAALYGHLGAGNLDAVEAGLAAATFALAALPALAALHCWRDEADGKVLPLPLASAAATALGALLMLAPAWLAPVSGALTAATLAALAWRRPVTQLADLAWAGAGILLLLLLVDPTVADAELERLFGLLGEPVLAQALVRWACAVVPFAILARADKRPTHRRTAEAVAALLAYGLVAQIAPGDALAWAAALGSAAVALAWRERAGAAWALGGVAALWALPVAGEWAAHALAALAGRPMTIADQLHPREVALALAPLAVAIAAGWWALKDRTGRLPPALLALGGAVAVMGLHIVWKQAFGITDTEAFARLGMVERTLWELGLALAGAALVRFAPARSRPAGYALLAASLAHFALFTLALHNPLVARQAIGPLPFADWLTLSYGVAIAILVLARRAPDFGLPRAAAVLDGAVMLLIAVYALSELRHLFAGTYPSAGQVGQTEDLLRSLLGIVLALGFLWWGSRSGLRSWRLGSLVLMLLAVGKVFLIDAAGLDDLLRIASFLALGVSLIGIGWVYSRQLARRDFAAS